MSEYELGADTQPPNSLLKKELYSSQTLNLQLTLWNSFYRSSHNNATALQKSVL